MDLIKDFFLEAFPNPERADCPTEEVLRFLAEGRLPPGHLALLHIASCSECFREYRSFCFELQDAQDPGDCQIRDCRREDGGRDELERACFGYWVQRRRGHRDRAHR